jgi:hypothetical protein
MAMVFFRARISAMRVVEPGAGSVALEAVQGAALDNLDGAKLLHRHRQQQACCGTVVAGVPRLWPDEIGTLDEHDGPDQQPQ